jgi:hypothetical protein
MIAEFFQTSYANMLSHLNTVANRMLHLREQDVEIWVKGEHYESGDVVYGSLHDAITRS